MSKWIADRDAPVSLLSVNEGFQGLSSREQRYAHYMSKASHAGTRVVLRQVSHESEAIFDLILAVHRALDGQYPSDDVNTQLYLDYVTQFLSNLGNYKSFGDSKFIPGCSRQFLFDLVHLAGLRPSNSPKCSCPFDTLQELIDKGIYGIDDTVTFLGYPAEGFVSSYYLGEKVSQADMKMLKEEVFASLGILPENTRINKISDKAFEVWIASAAASNTIPEEYPISPVLLPNGATVSFKFGDHSREMNLIASYLQRAKEYTANERQSQMLEQYIKHFSSGSSQAHKEAQKLWVKDLSPAIETNIGFIETYREPSGIIGEFESLVAIQNKQRTAKFTQLVQNAQEFIALLPWGKEWEKPVFNPPDFTSIEVLTFTGSGIPAGINIPNYDDVRINIGFKNVSLGNILSASLKATSERPPSFIAVEDRTLYTRYQADAFEIQVGIHELLGHGSGKLLCEVEGGFNFDHQNPPLGLDGKPVTTFYKLGETWGSKFGPVAGPFEECRAEVVAMYLITNRKILEIFGFHSKESQDAVIHVAYLQMCRAGLLALEFWDPSTGKWGQPHMQARFSIMKTFLMHSPDPGLLKLVESADGKDLHIKVNSNLIKSAGQACIEDYLRHLHILKCSGDFGQGAKYFADRCAVPAGVAKLREMVISKRLPRRQFIQSNTCVSYDGQVKLQEYNEHPLGMLQSFIERDL